MDPRAFLESVAPEGSLVHVRELPARAPTVEPFPADVPSVVADRLSLLGVTGLYPHQRQALDLIRSGRDVMVATGTASGKTLVYDLAFAAQALERAKSTALLLFPTKALARDQLRAVRELRLPQLKAAVYDGDTPRADRPLIRRNANMVMTNPDMLHASILPDHARWADFFLRLSLVVVDEAHVCRGVFGSHVAHILRRLRRLVARYGGAPRFVLASATVGNPAELAGRLVGVPFEAVTADASPSGAKVFALWNPPVIDEESGARRGALTDASTLMARLAEEGVKSYRAGYLAE
ncbi:MAG TPA: DEAD/DEAH box helicase, partial [Solirubrobacter sp.]|nr:DEAD/DEAH box helicase [Solirubrobacter sp.]